MRSELIESFNVWLQVPPEALAIITKVVAMLHTSSLLYVSFAFILSSRHLLLGKFLTHGLQNVAVSTTLKMILFYVEGSQVNWRR